MKEFKLLPIQKKILESSKRYKIIMPHRHVGKSNWYKMVDKLSEEFITE